jgi:uncharacterized alkaline shock family protein YloU
VSSERPNASPAPATPAGRIEISPQAIAAIVRGVLVRTYGVVDLAPTRRGVVFSRLVRPDPLSAIEVRVVDEAVVLTLHIVVEYGVRISEVARNVQENVAFAVEKHLGMPVREVNVHVDGLHFANEE